MSELDTAPGVDKQGSTEQREQSREDEHKGHGHWMMIACCVPMIALAIILVATGVVGSGVILAAVACTAMMAAMMVAMSGGGSR